MKEILIDSEYFPEDIDGLQVITNALINERLILFVGSGISIASGAPSWRELILNLLDFAKGRGYIKNEKLSLAKKIIETQSTTDFLIALNRLAFSYQENKNELNQDLNKIFKPLKPSSLHYKIANLDIKGIVTTNYDTLIEQANPTKYLNNRLVFSQDNQYDKLEETNWIYKIHGDINSNNQIIFPNDFSKKLKEDVFYENYKNLLNSYNFLFIGFGLTDPILMEILHQLKSKLHNAKEHFVLTPIDEFYKIKRHFYSDRYNLRLIPYDKKGNHVAVEKFIDMLTSIQTDTNIVNEDNYLLLVIHGIQHNTHDHYNVILVTTNYDKYFIEDENQAKRISYMLPSIKVDSLNLSEVEIKRKIKEKFHLNELDYDLAIEHDNIIEDIKQDPYLSANTSKELTKFHFLPCRITMKRNNTRFCNPGMYIGEVKYTWKNLRFLQRNSATIRFNNNVILKLVKLYGDSLETLDDYVNSSTPKIFVDLNEHLYTVDSSKYSISDEKEFNNLIFEKFKFPSNFKLYGLGCGKAQVGLDILAKYPNINYFGLEKNEKVIEDIHNLQLPSNFKIFNYDIFDDEFRINAENGILLLKDVIHNISNFTELISQIRKKFLNYSEIIVVETISPNLDLKTWIQVLFERVDIRYKHHFFTENDITNLFKYNNFRIVESFKHNLYIDVDKWLDAKNVDENRKQIAKDFILNSDEEVKKSFEIKTKNNKTTLLRQKFIMRLVDLNK
jgi:hypothetical protein